MNRKKILTGILVTLVLITQFIFQLVLAKSDSQTTDEAVHISAGYTYLTKHDFRFNPEHPTIVKILAGIPLTFLNLKTPDDSLYFSKSENFFYDSWLEARSYGEDFFYGLGNNADLMLFAARVPMALLTLLLGLTIFFISSKLFGIKGGLLSLILYSLEPIVLAHGHLVTTDIGSSMGFILSIYTFWLFLNKQTWLNLTFFAISLGIAQLMKFTAIIIFPILFILFIYYLMINKKIAKQTFKVIAKIALACFISLFIIWAGYGFNAKKIPPAETDQMQSLDKTFNNPYLSSLKPILIPRDYYKGLLMVVSHTQYGHDSFLLGRQSKTGWWYYFPVIFIAKTTLPLLIIFTISLVMVLKNKKIRQKALYVLISAVIFLMVSMSSKANLGVRHILPFYSFLFILSGATIKFFEKTKFTKFLLAILAGWIIVETIKTSPNFLSYFNSLFGGTNNGYKVATDSNYDWGQDLKRIKAYLDEHKEIQEPLIEYSWDGVKSLQYYQLAVKPTTNLPANYKGFIIVGASSLENPSYEALHNQPVYDRITPSVFVYKLN